MAHGAGTEIELKLRVESRAELEAVARAARGRDRGTVRQRNHFFDTSSWRLRAAGFGLRLRDEDGVWFLTAKGPAKRGSGAVVSARQEEEVELPAAVAEGVLAGADPPLDVLARHGGQPAAELAAELMGHAGGEAVALVGTFENRRRRVDCELGGLPVTLELDETTFPGGIVQHEVEVEIAELGAAERVEEALSALLRAAGAHPSPGRGKAARFFRALQGLPI